MSEKLERCPFCGGDANAASHSQHMPGCYFDVLANLKASPRGDCSLLPELVAAWNRRAPAAAANVPEGWKITADEEGWGIVSPSGDGCYLWDVDARHGQISGRAIREVMRQLCSSLVYPTAAAPQPSKAED